MSEGRAPDVVGRWMDFLSANGW